MPDGLAAKVAGIQVGKADRNTATTGENVGFSLEGVLQGEFKRGSMVGSVDSPPIAASEIEAQIVDISQVFDPRLGGDLFGPNGFVLHMNTAQVGATISEIVELVDADSGRPTGQKSESITPGQSAVVKIQISRPTVVELFDDFPSLGRIVLRNGGRTVAAGIVRSILAGPSAMPQVTSQLACKKCSFLNQPGDLYCTNCGSILKG